MLFVVVVLFLSRFFLYSFDIEYGGSAKKDFSYLYFWQNRTTARLFSKYTQNSRIYKEYLLYEAKNNPSKRPARSWLGYDLVIADVTSDARKLDITQGYSYDSVRVRALPNKWDKATGIMIAKVDGNDMSFKINSDTLIYKISAQDGSVSLVGRGKDWGDDFLKSDYVQMFVVGNVMPVDVLDVLIFK